MKRRTDEEISAPLYAYDADIRAQYGCFAGVDEAGRGPLCGPVCVAACILDPEAPVYGINDSKKLSEKKREALFDQIVEKALAYRIVFVGPDIIDRDNILNATMGGMRQAVERLDIVPNLVLVDGNRIPAGLTMPAQPVVKGDATSASIGAASILAKVSRDRYMLELDKQYPQYQLAKHKGYGTKLHYELIAQYGIQPFYRRSFLKKQGLLARGQVMDRAGTGRRGEAAAARFYEKTGRGPHHPQLSHPDGGDRPHPAGTGRNTGVLRGKDPSPKTLWIPPLRRSTPPSSAVSSHPPHRISKAPIRATSRCVSTWPKSSLLTAGAGWYIL